MGLPYHFPYAVSRRIVVSPDYPEVRRDCAEGVVGQCFGVVGNQGQCQESRQRAPGPDLPLVNKLCPAGKPLRLEAREWPRVHRQKSMSTGEYLCWDYSAHAGCGEKNSERPERKHELMSSYGLRGSILMQLARRGGRRSGRKIRPEEVDGRLQAIRDSMSKEELGKKKPAVISKKPPPSDPPRKMHLRLQISPMVTQSTRKRRKFTREPVRRVLIHCRPKL